MTEYNSAFEEIRATYDDEILLKIADKGCINAEPVDGKHNSAAELGVFFDQYEDEIMEYLADKLGDEFSEEQWFANPCDIRGYKNDITQAFIELIAENICRPDDEEGEDL